MPYDTALDPYLYQKFSDFCLHNLVSGGPDPHMRYTGWLCQQLDTLEEKAWLIGCYVSVYNFPNGEIIWDYLNYRQTPEEIMDWVALHWSGLKLRRERRPVRTPLKLGKCLATYAAWISSGEFMRMYDEPVTYDRAWAHLQKNVWGIGRYSGLRVLESFIRYADLLTETPDIRPVGGWSPRETLVLLYPSLADKIRPKDDSKEPVALSHELTLNLLEKLAKDNVPVDMYRIGSLLCEYHQAVLGRQYPGRANSTEIKYLKAVQHLWPEDRVSRIWEARKALHDPEWLDEENGWDGPREDLEPLLMQTGLVWSDYLYDYNNTVDLKNPVKRREYDHEDLFYRAWKTFYAR